MLKMFCAVFFISVFIKLTFLPALKEASFYDTGYAWYLSKIMTVENFVTILRAQGHFIIWYLIIMPFAKLNVLYPYSIQFINWLFCFFATVYLWKKSPFNIFINAIITLSFIMTQYFAVIARCYSIGILGLFFVASMYKNFVKRPVLYSFILGLTANTSLFAAIPSFAFALIFIYDLYKNNSGFNKKRLIPLSILLFLFGFAFFPFLTGKTHFVPSKNFADFFCILPEFIYTLPLVAFLIVSFYILLKSNSKIKFFYLFSICTSTLFLLFFYKGELYHRFFLIIYAIIAMWADENLLKLKKETIPLYIAFTVLMFFKFDINFVHINELYKTLGLSLQKKGNHFENSIIIIPDKDFRYTLLPYTKNNGKITLYEENNSYSMNFELNLKDKNVLNKLIDYANKTNEPVYVFSFYEIADAKLITRTEEDYYDNAKLYIYKIN